jgi:hypothetical protein
VKRNNFEVKYWKKNRFAQATYYEKELDKLVMNNIPVDAFYVKKRAQEKFHEIATRARGQCEMLDINLSLGSNMLTDLITEEILNNIGGQLRRKDLVSAYRTFPKSDTSTAESISEPNDDSSVRNRQTVTTLSSVVAKATTDLFQTSKKLNSSVKQNQ